MPPLLVLGPDFNFGITSDVKDAWNEPSKSTVACRDTQRGINRKIGLHGTVSSDPLLEATEISTQLADATSLLTS